MPTLDSQTVLIFFVGIQVILLIFKNRAKQWHFDSDKPYLWNESRQNGELPHALLKLEQASSDKVRFYNFWFQVQRLQREAVPGAFVELGVYKGETAEWLHIMAPERHLHLFDTFEGFHSQDLAHEKSFGKAYKPGRFSDTDLVSVQKRLGDSLQLTYHPGYFPDTLQNLEDRNFALVHLDADLYWPTLQACQYFYQALAPGGVLIVHDYNHNWDGVKQALTEFSQTIPENLIEIPDRQGSVMIIKQKLAKATVDAPESSEVVNLKFSPGNPYELDL